MVMGLGQAGIGLCVMHDANHGSYSKRKWLNQIMQYSTDLIGASSFTWKIQHNVLHHSFTNVYEWMKTFMTNLLFDYLLLEN